jgi:integral membrane protein (TIGR01906 family)
MKIIQIIAYCFFICFLPLLIITSDIHWGVTEIKLYEYGVDKYQISQVTGIDKSELMKVHQHLIEYYNSKVDSAQVLVISEGEEIAIFNERELVHLQDVKALIHLDYLIQMLAFIFIICSAVFLLRSGYGWRMLIKALFWGSVATLCIVGILTLWAVFGFDQLFLLFHLVSFSNEYWILDPATDFLIMLFPTPFFYDVALFGLSAVIVQSLILGGISFGVLKFKGWRER